MLNTTGKRNRSNWILQAGETGLAEHYRQEKQFLLNTTDRKSRYLAVHYMHEKQVSCWTLQAGEKGILLQWWAKIIKCVPNNLQIYLVALIFLYIWICKHWQHQYPKISGCRKKAWLNILIYSDWGKPQIQIQIRSLENLISVLE